MIKSIFPKLNKVFPQIEEGYYYKYENIILVPKKTLAEILSVSTWTIVDYEKKGLERWVESPNMLPLYDLEKSIKFKLSIKQKHKPNRQKQDQPQVISQESNDLTEFLEQLPPYKRDIFNFSELDIMDKLAKLRDIEKKEIDNKIKRGELIDANDVDKNDTARSAMFMGSFINFEKISGSILGNREEHEIPKLIREAHDNMFHELDEIVNKEFNCDDTLYEVIGAVLIQLNQGATPKEIIERVEG